MLWTEDSVRLYCESDYSEDGLVGAVVESIEYLETISEPVF